jgi:hypothetical protein
MERANKVVRVRDENTILHTYETYLTTLKQFRKETIYIMYGSKKILWPYKWYELQRFITVPAYKLLSSFDHFAKQDFTTSKKANTAARSIMLLIWAGVIFILKEVLKTVIPILIERF